MPARRDESSSEDLVRAAREAIYKPPPAPPDTDAVAVSDEETPPPPAERAVAEAEATTPRRTRPPPETPPPTKGLRYPAPAHTPIPTEPDARRNRRSVVVGAGLIGALVVAILAANIEGGGESEGPGVAFGDEKTQVGECFNSPELVSAAEAVDVGRLDLVPCAEAHDYETYAVVRYPTDLGDAYPGDDVLGDHGSAECAALFADFVGTSWFDAGYDISPTYPNESSWRAGDRDIQCNLIRLDGQRADRSAGGAGSIVPESHVSVFGFAEGDCFDESGFLAFGIPMSCDDAHDVEVYAIMTSPGQRGADYPGFDEVSSYAGSACRGEFFRRVDPELATDLEYGSYVYPVPLTWALGHRTYVCALWAADLSSLTGSQLAAWTVFDALRDAVFDEGTPTAEFADFTSVDDLVLVGSAQQESRVLTLTEFAEHAERGAPFEDEMPQRGAAWFSEKISVESGFETVFAFQMEHYSWFTIGDGFAFVIQNEDATALGQDIGYHGIPNSVAIEFDTVRQDFLGDPTNQIDQAPDLLANHVSVQTRGTNPNDVHIRASLGWARLEPLVLADRAAHVALIRYVPGEMSIYVDDFETPALTVDIDLAGVLDLDAGAGYAGFTASSGPRITGHKILGWELGPTIP